MMAWAIAPVSTTLGTVGDGGMGALMTVRGELAALAGAMIWAIASVVYSHLGQRLSPLVLNLVKSGLAILMLVLTLAVLQQPLAATSSTPVLLLLLSGAIGIGLGDTAFFGCINRLGARRALLMEALAPPLTALLALLTLHEYLQAIAWWGIALTVAGVTWVIAERTRPATLSLPMDAPPSQWRVGVALGVLAALGQAVGAVLSRAALATTDISPLWSTVLRLVAGVFVLSLGVGRQPHLLRELKWLRSPKVLRTLVFVAFAGTYLGIWLQQTALKFTAAGIAQSLGATSPLFVLPLALRLGEPLSVRAWLGVLIALAGIWLLLA